MTGFIADGQPMESPIDAATQGYLETPPSEGERFGAMFGEESIVGRLARFGARLGDTAANQNAGEVQLPADQVNKQYGPIGPDGKQVPITTEPMYADTAAKIGQAKSDEMDRDGILQRGAQVHSGINSFLMGTAAFMADPVNAAATFIPGVGEENVLRGAASIGLPATGFLARSAARVVSGATMGAGSQLPLTALKYGLGQQEASDYDLRSAMKDMLYSAAGAAILQGGFGAIGDAWKARGSVLNPKPPATTLPEANAIMDAPVADKAAAMKSTVSQIVTGREPDPDSVLAKDLPVLAEKQRSEYETGFAPGMTGNELTAAKEQLLPEGEKPEPQSRLDQPVIDRYKKTIKDEATRLGIPLDDEGLNKAATVMAQTHNPENVSRGTFPEETKSLVLLEKKFSPVENKSLAEVRHPETGKTYEESLREAASRPKTDTIDTPERQQLRAKIADDLYGGGASKKEGVIHIVTGLPGAGKSDAVVDGLAKKTGAIVIDSDKVKERLPEYDHGNGAQAVHKESVDIARKSDNSILNKALKNNDNIVMPVVGKDYDGLAYDVDRYKKLGYNVYISHVDTNAENATQRIINRFAKTGRSVPLDYFKEAEGEVKNVYQKIKENPNVSGYAEVDNNGTIPRITESSSYPEFSNPDGRLHGGEERDAGSAVSPETEAASGRGNAAGNREQLLTPEQAEIANLQSKINPSRMTAEENADISGAAKDAAEKNADYEAKLKAWTDCLAGTV